MVKVADKRGVGRESRERGDAAKIAHGGVRDVSVIREKFVHFLMVKAERTVGFEGSHAAQQSVMFEKRHAPFNRLGRLRAGAMHEGAQMAEDGLRKRGGFRDVGVDAGVGLRRHGL